MRALILADTIEKLKPKGDTSLAFLRELLRRGADCYYATEEDLRWKNALLHLKSKKVLKCEEGAVPELGACDELSVLEFDFIFIRKDPPFDDSYLRICWLLSPFEKKVRMVNRPSLLLRHHEKMIPLEAAALGYLKEEDVIPTLIPSGTAEAVAFVEQLTTEQIILKPWLGYGGNSVQLVDRKDFLKRPSYYLPEPRTQILQPFLSEIYDRGDRRVFIIHGEYKGDFVRLPKKGHFVSNLAQGGSASLSPLSASEREMIERIARYVRDLHIDFAGVDLLAGKVSEVNITSPTGIPSYKMLTGVDLSGDFIGELMKG